MIVPEYTPGDWFAVVGGGVVVLLAPTTPADVVRGVWQAAPERGGIAAQLEVLLGQGIAGLHAFAAVDLTGGRAHVALRGDVEVTLGSGGDAQVLAARDVVTWSEHVTARPEVVTVRAGAARPGGVPAGGELPVVAGVVRADRVRVRLSAPAAPKDEVADEAPVAAGGGTRAALRTGPTAPTAPAPTAPAPAEPVADHLDPAPRSARVPVRVGVLPAGPADQGADPFDHAAAPTAAPPHASADTAPDGLASAAGAPGHPQPAPLTQPLVGVVEPAALLPVPGPVVEDHDGLTIVTGDLAAIRQHLPSWATAQGPGAAPWTGALPAAAPVAAAVGALGTLAPEHLGGGTRTAVAPAGLRLVLSSGQIVPLDRTVLIGRAPQATRVSSRDVPRLVTVPSPEQDISRTHAQVRVEGGLALVTDLDSTNGITVTTGGGPARALPAGTPCPVGPGDLVDLGDGVTFVVESGA